ncbi:MAG TPA: TIGR03619 family F420-dependent LLM class oxidoreductase [Candidatus Limnocylindrales bacterium]
MLSFGSILPNFRAGASGEGLAAAAETAERLGWETIWTTDHVLVDTASAEEYGRIFEALTTLAWLGARHPGVRLGTSVIVVPQRNAVVLAKELATLDALSGGRVIAGVGVGWSESEFRSLGEADRFRRRGTYLDETIALWRHLWSGSQAPFRGRFHELEDYVFGPLPAQGADLPIWVGGRSEAAYRRAGRVGDGYHSSAVGPGDYAPRIPVVRAAAEAAGRALPILSARVAVHFGEHRGSGYRIAGDAGRMLDEVLAFADLGVEHLAVGFDAREPADVAAAMERFDREVVLAFRDRER